MSEPRLTVQVRFAWWLRVYIHGVVLCAVLMGMEPDWKKVERVIARATRLKVGVAPAAADD